MPATTPTPTEATTYRVMVRDGGEWGEFFIHEQSPVVEGESVRHAASWTCVSSYGVFGHHWSHMGSPFAQFIAGVDQGYLLGKIGKQVFDADRFKKWLSREIFTSSATKEEKRRASTRLREILADHDSEVAAALAFEDPDISACQPEWCDADTRSCDRQAVAFAERLWPKFVDAVVAATQP